MKHRLTKEIASRFAQAALGHVRREFPNKLDHVLECAEDSRPPREFHPIFYGSFDWHSCVHAHWLLARLYRRFSDLPEASAIRELFDENFQPEKVDGECRYLDRPSARGFERPYGWAWLLMLQAELLHHTSQEADRWRTAMQPLADRFAERFKDFLPASTYPVRVGMHGNSAFALLLARSYGAISKDRVLAGLCEEKAKAWFGSDRDAGRDEPSQADFLSPSLTVAALMSGVLTGAEFEQWFRALLPGAAKSEPAPLFSPAFVADRTDGQIAHLDGLNLSRAWCWRLIAAKLKPDGPLAKLADRMIDDHIGSALDHVTGDYMGEHWLASFALLALDPVTD